MRTWQGYRQAILVYIVVIIILTYVVVNVMSHENENIIYTERSWNVKLENKKSLCIRRTNSIEYH